MPIVPGPNSSPSTAIRCSSVGPAANRRLPLRDQIREWVFYTDPRTFRARYHLVVQRGLQGFCSWVLGKEDAGIWDLLPQHP